MTEPVRLWLKENTLPMLSAVIIVVVAWLSIYTQFGSAEPQVPVCVSDEDRVHIRAQVLAAIDEAFRDNIKHLFIGWLKNSREQPKRASAGLQNSIVAYQRARNDAMKWSPVNCG